MIMKNGGSDWETCMSMVYCIRLIVFSLASNSTLYFYIYIISIGGCLLNFSLNTTHIKNLGPLNRNGRSELINLFGMERNSAGNDYAVLRVSDGTVAPVNWLQEILHNITTEFKNKDDKILQLQASFRELAIKTREVDLPFIPESSDYRREMNLEQEICEFTSILKLCNNWARKPSNNKYQVQQALVSTICKWEKPWIKNIQRILWTSELSFLLSALRNPIKSREFLIGNPFYRSDNSRRTQHEFLQIFTADKIGEFYMVWYYLNVIMYNNMYNNMLYI